MRFNHPVFKAIRVIVSQAEYSNTVVGLSAENVTIYFYYAPVKADLNKIKDEEEAEVLSRSILVTGIPLNYSEQDVQEVFETLGSVSSLFFLQDTTTHNAQVTFETIEDYERAMTAENPEAFQPGTAFLGLNKWKNNYLKQRPDPAALQNQVDLFLFAFDQRTIAEKSAKINEKPIYDEEGFMLVRNTNPKRKAQESAMMKNAAKKYKQKLLDQQQNIVSFYSYQDKERKLERINLLRHKFLEDKKKIKEITSQRKFKPF